MAIKAIGYAYPSSDTASRLGAVDTGCFFVETKAHESTAKRTSLRGPFSTIELAELHAAAIACEWSRYTKRAA